MSYRSYFVWNSGKPLQILHLDDYFYIICQNCLHKLLVDMLEDITIFTNVFSCSLYVTYILCKFFILMITFILYVKTVYASFLLTCRPHYNFHQCFQLFFIHYVYSGTRPQSRFSGLLLAHYWLL